MAKKIFWLTITATALFIADRLTKYLILKLPANEGVLGLKFNLVYNHNLSFSLPLPNLAVGLLAIVMILFLVWFLIRNLANRLSWPLSLMIVGALSNLIDRFKFGGVIDFINLEPWPSFNLADAYIITGALLIIILFRKNYFPALKTDSGSLTRQADSK
ncbi:MAG TPA: signal peptidase II [Patescibacteria group bacterium]|nr:signal peptidase II [Patescibacteria group bacterium]